MHGIVHILRAADAQGANPVRIGQGGRAGDQRDARAGFGRRRRQRVTHLAGTAVGDATHGIDGFPGGTGGNKDVQAIQLAGFKQAGAQRRQFVRFQHAPGTGLAAGLRAVARTQDTHTALA